MEQISAIVMAFLLSVGSFFGIHQTQNLGASTFITQQGGTGTSSPSGILYGDNGATNHLNTVLIGSGLTFVAGTLTASSGIPDPFDIATTTDIAISQLAFYNKVGGITTIAGVSTTTLTGANSAITVSNSPVVIGSAGSVITCATASGSQNGCLSSTDWTTFNGKGSGSVTSVATGEGLSGGTITTTGTIVNPFVIATTSSAVSALTISGIPYYTKTTGQTTIGSVATGTVSAGNGISLDSAVRSVIGGSLAISNSGVLSNVAGAGISVSGATGNVTISQNDKYQIATSSTDFGTNQVVYVTKVGGLTTFASVATSSIGATGPITFSGTAGAQIGGVAGTFGCATCLTGNQTITLSGAVTGSGATTITTAFGTMAQGILGNPFAAATIPTPLATSSIYLGSPGQVLAKINGRWEGVATTTAGTGLTYDGTSFNNSGVLSITASAPLSRDTATGAVTISCPTCVAGSQWPFTTGVVNFGTTTQSTSTPLWLRGSLFSLFASSTAVFVNASSTMNTITSNLWLPSLTTGGLAVDNLGLVYKTSTTSDSCGTGITCTYASNTNVNTFSIANNALTLAMFPTIAAGTVIGNGTGGTATPTAVSTSTLFGIGINGQILSQVSGSIKWVSTTTAGTGLTYDGTAFNNSGVLSITATSPLSRDVATGAVTISCPTCATASWPFITNAITFGTSTQSTSTPPWFRGSLFSLFASSTAVFVNASSTMNTITSNLWLPSLTTGMLAVDNLGLVYKTSTSTDTCGTGITCTYSSGTNVNTFSIGNNALTLTMFPTIAAGTFIGNGTGGTATPTAIATSSLFGIGANGTILAELAGIPTWVATTTLAAGTGITTTYSAATNQWTVANTGLATWPWTTATNFGTTTHSTSTPLWLRGSRFSLFASSTSVFDNASSTMQTIFSNLYLPSLTTGGLAVDNLGLVYKTSTTSSSCSTGITCTYTSGTNVDAFSIANNALTLAMFPTIGAGTFIGNGTGGTVTPTAISTSTIFGIGTNGFVLAEVNGTPQWVATSSITANNPFIIATTSDIAVPGLAYFTKTSGQTTLGSVATGTISSANSALTVTSGRSCIGGACVFTIATTTTAMFTGIAGQILAFTNQGWTGVATTTAGTGLTYTGTAFNVNATQSITNLSNLTTDGVVFTSGGNGTLNVDTGALDIIRGGTATTTFYNGGGVFYDSTLGTLSQGNAQGDFFYDKTNARLGLNDTSPDFRFEGVGTSGNGYFGLTKVTDGDVFSVVGNGNVGIGSTTPKCLLCVASSTFNPNIGDTLFNVSTSSNPSGQIFSITASTSTFAGNVVLGPESGARVTIGLQGTTGLTNFRPLNADQLTVNGRIRTGDWAYFKCDIFSVFNTVSADTTSSPFCGDVAFSEDNDGSTGVQSVGGFPFYRLQINIGVTDNGAMLYFGGTTGSLQASKFATTTPSMEMVFRIAQPQIATSTQIIFGFTDIDPAGSAMEVEPTGGCYLIASSTANFQAVCRTSATAVTQVDTGIASSTSVTGSGDLMYARVDVDGVNARFYLATSTLASFFPVAVISSNIITGATSTRPMLLVGKKGVGQAGLNMGVDFSYIDLWQREHMLMRF